ncbi:dihydropteroate synthase [Sphingobium algorifonticola]|uniref:dihydropteroate synthase n=1 Tax=Sphingobium algorifonticola TaxID=2008318 RepID=A0A437J9I1_9SPHN|nr:dihydropteroate synthase [Sphingobium algorifonticola]RVT42169.1 dihydropteroate synthase [Sphingobium algorifonticola]
MNPSQIPADARLTLRPVGFVDSPVDLDGRTARIGTGLSWFQAYEVVAVQADGRRMFRDMIPVVDFTVWSAQLPDPLAQRAATLVARIAAPRPPLHLGERIVRLDLPQVMGILNVTPDSFSDGGKHAGDPQAAADVGFAMMAAGAAIVDVGGESTRPGAAKLWEGDEIARVVPVIARLAASGVPVSIDTRKAAVMEAALGAGAAIVNDISALLHDPRSMDVVAQASCPVVLMHAPSTGDDPHANGGGYGDVVTDVFDWLEARIAACEAAGIDRGRIIADPGLGFGKSLTDNLALVNRLAVFAGLGVPLLFGGSRKRMIGALSNEAPAAQRLGGSVALAMRAADLGAQMVRVHDVPETVQALHIWRGLRDAALVAG